MRLALALVLLAQAAPGAKTVVNASSTMEVEIVIRDGSGEQTRLLNVSRSEKLSQEVLRAAEGRATAVRVQVLASTTQKSGTDLPVERKSTALEGRTYTAERSAEGWNAVDADGNAAPAEGRGLGAWNDYGVLLPKEGLKAGAEWRVEARDLLALVSPAGIREGAGAVTCACRAHDDRGTSIEFRGTVSGKAKDDSTVTLTVQLGRLELAGGRPKLFSITGVFNSSLDIVEVWRNPATQEEEKRKVGELSVRSRKLEAAFTFE
jgi:hypothetical protein